MWLVRRLTRDFGIETSSVNEAHTIQEKLEETKEVNRSRKSMKDRQYNGQKKKNKIYTEN